MLTPLDIENKKFQRKMMNGYNVDEVDDFLDEITVDYERLYKENTELRAEIERSKEDLEKYKTIEQTLQNTLVMAQKTADDIKNTAQDEADNIIKNARAKMQESVDELTKESETRKREFAETKKQFDIYRAKMEALLISQLELLKEEYIFEVHSDYLKSTSTSSETAYSAYAKAKYVEYFSYTPSKSNPYE